MKYFYPIAGFFFGAWVPIITGFHIVTWQWWAVILPYALVIVIARESE